MPPARLIILSTGGTIAMTKETAQGSAVMTLCAANLIAAVPRLADLAEVEALDVLAKPSADFTLADIAPIADAAAAGKLAEKFDKLCTIADKALNDSHLIQGDELKARDALKQQKDDLLAKQANLITLQGKLAELVA